MLSILCEKAPPVLTSSAPNGTCATATGPSFSLWPLSWLADHCWVGWFGIRPRFRREGFGTNAMYGLFDIARSIGCQELWVYTGLSDDVAVSFYKSLGFEVLGSAVDWALGRTMDDLDIVLRRML